MIKLFSSQEGLTPKAFLRQLFYMALVAITVGFITIMWLRFYTNHGQKLEMPRFIDMHVDDARSIAKKKTFQVVVTDSVHIIGQPGGMILDQNPSAGSFVKENRKIYVRTTKYRPDKIKSKDLPVLYGSNYNQKRKELSQRGITTKIKDYKYDSGEPDHILEVWYKDQILFDANIARNDVEIEKGGTLEVVLSKRTGGSIEIPDLTCYKLKEARYVLEESKLNMGSIEGGGDGNVEEYYIIGQSPSYSPGTTITMGESINVILSPTKPDGC